MAQTSFLRTLARLSRSALTTFARRARRWAGSTGARGREAADPSSGAQPAGGPPAHWVERVRRGAPGLLEPGAPALPPEAPAARPHREAPMSEPAKHPTVNSPSPTAGDLTPSRTGSMPTDTVPAEAPPPDGHPRHITAATSEHLEPVGPRADDGLRATESSGAAPARKAASVLPSGARQPDEARGVRRRGVPSYLNKPRDGTPPRNVAGPTAVPPKTSLAPRLEPASGLRAEGPAPERSAKAEVVDFGVELPVPRRPSNGRPPTTPLLLPTPSLEPPARFTLPHDDAAEVLVEGAALWPDLPAAVDPVVADIDARLREWDRDRRLEREQTRL